MWQEYLCETSLDSALRFLAENGAGARLIAGGTDLVLELERGARPGVTSLVDVSRIPGLDRISLDDSNWIHLGPRVTHNQFVASALLRERALPLALACWEVGAPQIRNRGTIAGNLITASPANDTIPPLIALGAWISLRSMRGERSLPLAEFYTGVRRTVLQPDEALVDIRFPALKANQKGTFIKIGLRRAQAISLINVALVLEMAEAKVARAVIALGAVAPTIVRATQAESALVGARLTENAITAAAHLAQQAGAPISDIRSSAQYRDEMVRVAVLRGLRSLSGLQDSPSPALPAHPPLLWGRRIAGTPALAQSRMFSSDPSTGNSAIITRINGREYRFAGGHRKTLLRLLREDAGLTGAKEGCAEGECGACTVFLDGQAVMSCLVPAGRAHGAEIETVESLAQDGILHPVQQAFIDTGAVQCGYCTPGFVMSAVKLLEENPQPSREEIRQAITGNLCRCTGYYSIVAAIEQAARHGEKSDHAHGRR